jgi:hypothetical protein
VYLSGRKRGAAECSEKTAETHYAWKCLSKLIGKRLSDGIQVKKDDRWCSDQEAAKKINSHFINKVAKLQKSMQNASADPLEGPRRRAKAKGIKSNSFQLHTVSVSAVRKALKTAKKSEAKRQRKSLKQKTVMAFPQACSRRLC